MTFSRLQIAGIDFEVTAGDGLTFTPWPGVYGEFVDSDAAPAGEVSIPVHVHRGPPEELERATVVFEGRRTWAALARGTDRYIVHAPDGPGRIRWAARVPADFHRVTVGCGPDLATPSGRIDCPLRYPLDQVLLMHYLATRGGLLIHAAGWVLEDRLFVFAGRSGAGKSTLSRLLASQGRGRLLSDDRLVLRRAGSGFTGFGTPWPGTERIARQGSGAVAGLFVLRHGSENRAVRITPKEALDEVIPVTSVLWHERAAIEAALETCAGLAAGIPCYRFDFTPDPRAAEAALRAASQTP